MVPRPAPAAPSVPVVTETPPLVELRTAQLPPLAFSDPERLDKLRAVLPDIEAKVEKVHTVRKMHALAVGVVIDGELVWAKGYGQRDARGGEVDGETMFRIASITKTFTAMSVLQLHERGRIELDVPAAHYLPQLNGLVYPTTDAGPLTVRQLLSHSSGLPRLGDWDYTNPKKPPTETEVLRSLDGFAVIEPPGTVHRYSNMGVALLGLIVQKVGHADYPC